MDTEREELVIMHITVCNLMNQPSGSDTQKVSWFRWGLLVLVS